MRSTEYKILRHMGKVEFYNLLEDPFESENLLDRDLSEAEQTAFDALEARLDGLRTGRQTPTGGAR
jgi:hypothetical protein